MEPLESNKEVIDNQEKVHLGKYVTALLPAALPPA